MQPDGKIVAGGYNDASDDFTLVRYNTNGSPDTTFDGDGIVVTDFSGNTSDIREIALDGSNRIVATGMANPPDPAFFGFAVARYNTNGSPDTAFNGTGRTIVSIANSNLGGETGYSVLVQPDAKIVAMVSRTCLGRIGSMCFYVSSTLARSTRASTATARSSPELALAVTTLPRRWPCRAMGDWWLSAPAHGNS